MSAPTVLELQMVIDRLAAVGASAEELRAARWALDEALPAVEEDVCHICWCLRAGDSGPCTNCAKLDRLTAENAQLRAENERLRAKLAGNVQTLTVESTTDLRGQPTTMDVQDGF